MVRTHKEHLARLHALWTLEGLEALTPELVSAATRDAHPQIRAASIRLAESLIKSGNSAVLAESARARP
jgi:hypothetical protein